VGFDSLEFFTEAKNVCASNCSIRCELRGCGVVQLETSNPPLLATRQLATQSGAGTPATFPPGG
jgi:hypothetical protein